MLIVRTQMVRGRPVEALQFGVRSEQASLRQLEDELQLMKELAHAFRLRMDGGFGQRTIGVDSWPGLFEREEVLYKYLGDEG